MPADLAILVPVYHPYRWVAPYMQRGLDAYWKDHPSTFFCGLLAEEADGLPVLPLHESTLPRDWSAFMRDAVGELLSRGFTKCYLLLEEHLPLAECHATHLNVTLPRLLDELDAAYIGLMGWDNRRYTTRAPILDETKHRLMHLSIPSAPRFHLHPSLWRLEALRDCLDLVLRDPVHTPWRFEKVTERADADLPARWKQGCYQICGEALALQSPTGAQAQRAALERFFLHKLMALHPLLPSAGLRKKFWESVGFDNFFYNGPYPMFFSGVMAKGGINPHFVRHIEKHPAHAAGLADKLAELAINP
jgi:hypothetical protein